MEVIDGMGEPCALLVSPALAFWCCPLCPERARQESPGQRLGFPAMPDATTIPNHEQALKGRHNPGRRISEPLADTLGTLVSALSGLARFGCSHRRPRALPWAFLWLPLRGDEAKSATSKFWPRPRKCTSGRTYCCPTHVPAPLRFQRRNDCNPPPHWFSPPNKHDPRFERPGSRGSGTSCNSL